MQERSRFIDAYLTGVFTMTELCAHAGISRRIGYKWLARYDEFGRAGLADRSRAPHSCPHRIAETTAQLLCEMRVTHPDWGPKKIVVVLTRRHPALGWPAISSISELFARHGLIAPRRHRRPRYRATGTAPAHASAPNEVWTADFKGHFRTGDGAYCYPLTIADLHSRFLLACLGLTSTQSRGARGVFERVFREYGLPAAIRTDNGVPFATNGLRGLSALNIWWLRLGIQHHRIRPASPQENGAHERMHRTLKRGAIHPPRPTARAQQRAFDRFRASYNGERPHDALGGDTPSSRFTPSRREYPTRLPAIEYPAHFEVRSVSSAGTFGFHDHIHFLSRSLATNPIGLEEVDDGVWSVYLCDLVVARLDLHTQRIIRL